MIEIDRQKIYESHGYKFKNFVCLTDEEKRMVLDWRNSPNVRKWMYNSEPIELKDHMRFIDSLINKNDRYYWLVISPSNDYIGAFDITSVDFEKDFAEMGYYLNPSPLFMGEGLSFVKECHYFLFFYLLVGNNYGAIDKDNITAYLLAKYLGGVFSDENEKYYVTHNYDRDLFLERYEATVSDYISFYKKELKQLK